MNDDEEKLKCSKYWETIAVKFKNQGIDYINIPINEFIYIIGELRRLESWQRDIRISISKVLTRSENE